MILPCLDCLAAGAHAFFSLAICLVPEKILKPEEYFSSLLSIYFMKFWISRKLTFCRNDATEQPPCVF